MSKTTKNAEAFDPNPMHAFKQMMTQSQERLDGVLEEIERRQDQAVEQTRDAMGEVVKLAQGSLDLSASMTREMLELSRSATRWAGETMEKGFSPTQGRS